MNLNSRIHNKHLREFVIFDIKEFYLKIIESLLKKVFTFAEGYTLLLDDEKTIIHHAKKLLLCNDQQIWI